jgi:hypothetical protein
MDNIRNNEQNNEQDIRELRDNFKNIKEQDQEQKNRELRDNFRNIPKFMKDKGYE